MRCGATSFPASPHMRQQLPNPGVYPAKGYPRWGRDDIPLSPILPGMQETESTNARSTCAAWAVSHPDGRSALCAEPGRLAAEMEARALAVPGGRLAERDIEQDPRCALVTGHGSPHFAVVRSLTTTAVWLMWYGDVKKLLILEDCPDRTSRSDPCPLFTGHEGAHE